METESTMVSSTGLQPRNAWDPVKKMKLKRILGSTISGRFSLIQQPNTSNLIYIAGCVVVVFDTELKTQRHLFTSSRQPLTTLAVTRDGQFLAAASCCGGQHANIYVWDLRKESMVAEWRSSNSVVSCMCFSNNSRILVLAGDQRDPSLSAWDWRRQRKLSSSPADTKVRAIAFAQDDRYFVTVGHAHVVYWQVLFQEDSALISCSGSANLGDQKRNSFCDVKCGLGCMSGSFFCITNTGLLCEINESRLLHKWVDLRVSSANCLSLNEDLIAVGCSNGVVRCFSSQELRFLRNLPRPLNSDQQQQQQPNTKSSVKSSHPEVSSLALGDTTSYLSCQYADKSLYVWDLAESSASKSLKYSGLYHSSCIWGLDMYPSNSVLAHNRCLPDNSFITCSSDDSLRIWSPSVFDLGEASGDKFSGSRGPVSQELLQVIYTQDAADLNGTKSSLEGAALDSKLPNDSYDNSYGLRCLRIAPDGRQLAIGSRSGLIKVYNLESDLEEVKSIAAHDAEVLCLDYSDPTASPSAHFYLASSSRDKLIHIFDASNHYNFLQTIDDHSSSITALKFVAGMGQNCLQLVSCGADFKIIIREALIEPGGELNFARCQQIDGSCTFYDMAVVRAARDDDDHDDHHEPRIIAGCQDSQVRLYDAARAQYLTGFQGLGPERGAIIRLALDPSSTFLATSYTDKSIRVYDYQRAACIASIDYGLSDLVTDIKFTPNGRYLVACSGDGCVFIWDLPVQISSVICSKTARRADHEHQQHGTVINRPPASGRAKSLNDSSDQTYSDPLAPGNCLSDNVYAEINQPNERGAGYQVHNVQAEEDYMNLRFSSSMDLSGGSSLATNRCADHSSRAGFQAKWELLKSRDSLDLITKRQRYVSDNLLHAGNQPSSRRAPAAAEHHYQSLRSARAQVSQSNDDFRNMTFAAEPSAAGRSRLAAASRGQVMKGRQLERMAGSGLSQSMYLLETGAGERGNAASSEEEDEDEEEDYRNNRLASSSRQRSVTPPKPSQHRQFRRNPPARSEDCGGGAQSSPVGVNSKNNNLGAELLQPQQRNKPAADRSTGGNGQPVDRFELEPASLERCRSVARELEALSGYASRLHRQLQGGAGEAASLAALIERAAQSSIALLSGILLSCDESANKAAAAAISGGGGGGGVGRPRRHSRHQLLVSPPPPPAPATCDSAGAAKAKPGAAPAAPHYERPQVGVEAEPETGKARANLDKVLEAYSDRLFRLVQERMVESSAAAAAAAAAAD